MYIANGLDQMKSSRCFPQHLFSSDCTSCTVVTTRFDTRKRSKFFRSWNHSFKQTLCQFQRWKGENP